MKRIAFLPCLIMLGPAFFLLPIRPVAAGGSSPTESMRIEEDVPGGGITTTASSQFGEEQSVRHLVEGTGMDGLLHDNNGVAATMWHTVVNPAASRAAEGLPLSPAWVRFDFSTPRVIDTISIWNHNQAGLTDRGFRTTHLLGTIDGKRWTPLLADGKEVVTIPRASGNPCSPSSLSSRIACEFPLKAVVIAADSKDGNYGGNVYGLAAVSFSTARDIALKDLPVPTALDCQPHPYYLNRPDGHAGRAVTIHFKGPRLYGQATLDYSDPDGGNRQEIVIPANGRGTSSVEFALPPGVGVENPANGEITLHCNQTTLHQTVAIPAQRQWTVYIYPHAHVDIGYTTSQEWVEKIHVRNVGVGIDMGRKTANYPAGARHVWNTEAQWVVESYLRQATPEQKTDFIDAVRKGWVCLDANYDNANTSAMSDEEFLRFFRNGMELRKITGKPIDTMVQFDVPAMSWGVVQAAAQAGVRGVFSFPNHFARVGTIRQAWEQKPFWWVAPDGKTRVLFIQGCPYGMGWVIKGSHVPSPPFKSPSDRYPENLTGRFPSPMHEYRNDVDRVHTADPTANFLDPFIFQETARLEREGSPYDIYAMTWSMADNSLIDADLPDAVKAWNEKYAYPKLIIAGAHEILGAYEKKFGSIIPEVSGDYTEYWTDGLGSDARRVGLNRQSEERLVQIETLWSMLNRNLPAPLDKFHESWRFVMLGAEHTWGYYDPYAAYAKQVEATKASYFESGDKTSRDLLAAALHPIERPGSSTIAVINTLSWNRGGLVTLDANQSKLASGISDDQEHGIACQRLATGELAFLAQDVPALGSRTYRLQSKGSDNPPSSPCQASGLTLENGLVKVVLNPKTGDIASLIDQRSGHEFVDSKSPYALNSYRYLHGGDAPDKATGPTEVVIKVKENGPLVASLSVQSKAEGCKLLTREVRIIAGQHSVEMTDTLDKVATRVKEGVHFGFAFNVPGGTTHMDLPWGVMRPEADQIAGSNCNWLAFQRWIDISNDENGVTWTAIESPLVEFGTLTANLMGDGRDWLGHLSNTQTLFSWALNNHWFTNFPLQQGGVMSFHYQILPHAGYDAVAANRFGLEQNRPLVAIPTDKNPVSKPLVVIDNPRVAISNLKPGEDTKAVILRLRSVSDQPETVHLSWPGSQPKSIHLCLADEEPGEASDGTVVMLPYGVVGLRIEFP